MKILADMHTHTVASGHAYSTVSEMAAAAREKGLKLLGITEHAPAMPGTCNELYFGNLKVIPKQQEGLELLFGAELNILDFKGNIDLEEETLQKLDYTVASVHGNIFPDGTKEEVTGAYLRVMENPYVRIIGHPDDGRFPIDYKQLVKQAKETGVLLEVNNTSLSPHTFRGNAKENYLEMLSLCAEWQVPIILDSDAHIASDVGNTCYSVPFLESIQFPEELIVNRSIETCKKYLLKSSVM